ncbi:MAG: TonB-dependent receptor [Novosphingobium sp.]
MTVRHCLLLATALTVFPAIAHADEDADAGPTIIVNGTHGEDIAVADGTKTGTPLIDTPQSVAVLDREQLDDQGMEQLGDALRYVPGVTIGQGEGHRDQVILRGQSSTADFFLDGLRDDAQYYRPLYNTQQVEVLKGANALLFGRGGGGGIVNRVSKAPVLGAVRANAAGGIDNFGGWSVAGDVNLPLGSKAALRLNSTYEEFDNNRDFFGGHFFGIAPTVAIEPAVGTRVTLAYEYVRDDRVIDRGVPSLAGRPIAGYDRTFFGKPGLNHGTVDAHVARVRLEQDLGGGLTLDASGQYAFYDKYYANVLPASATTTTVTLSGYDSANTRSNWIGQTNLVWKGRTGPLGHTLLAGVEAGDQTSDALGYNVLFAAGAGTSLTTTVPLARTIALPATSWSAPRSSSRSTVQTLSFYLQDQIELAPWLQLIAGVRRDRFEIAATNRLSGVQTGRTDSKWSPRFGLVLKPRETVSLYASYAKSFLPQTGDQFSTLDPSYQSLDPEAFRNLEVGLKWAPSPTLSVTAAAFQLDRSNTRVADPANPGFWLLTGSSRVRGLEAALAGRITPDWQVNLGYTYQEGEIRSATSAAPAGRKLDKLPRHQASAWTRYDLTPRFGLGLGVVHQSGQYATISNAVWLPAFTRVDAAAYFTLSDNVSLQLNVENLTDTHYYASAHTDNNIQPGDPVNVKVSARLKF